MAVMTKTAKAERVYSHPTMCLHCHLIVEMSHERGAECRGGPTFKSSIEAA